MYLFNLKDLLGKQTLPKISNILTIKEVIGSLGEPDFFFIYGVSTPILKYGNYEFILNRETNQIRKIQNINYDIFDPSNFREKLIYKNAFFEVNPYEFMPNEDISWKELREILNLSNKEIRLKTQENVDNEIIINSYKLSNNLKLNFINHNIKWLFAKDYKNINYNEVKFEKEDDYILNEISYSF